MLAGECMLKVSTSASRAVNYNCNLFGFSEKVLKV